MRIVDTHSINRPASVKRTKGASSSSSFQLEQPDAGQPSALSGPSAPTAIGSLLSLQAVNDPAEDRRRAVSYGYDLLDQLDALKVSLLSGEMSSGQIKTLVKLVENRPQSDSPELEDLVGQIELRARVELAKLNSAAR